jgi:protoporphyrinogen oxidase
MLHPAVPSEIDRFNKRLTYRDQVQVALFVKKTHITFDTWIYVHSLELPYVRVMEMDNWSVRLSPKGTTTSVFEITCQEGDAIWNKSNTALVNMISKSFIKEFDLISQDDIIGSYVHRIPKEYPVYHIGYMFDLRILKNYLKDFTNLQIAGRNGIFRYNNMDHSIEMGLYAAWNIIEGERKFDIESINIEREYLEEKKAKKKSIELPEDESVEQDLH